MTMQLLGASVWEQEVFDHLQRHVDGEKLLLASYRDVADETDSDALRYLLTLILEDEIVHHRLFMELANTVQGEVAFCAVEPSVPALRADRLSGEGVAELAEKLIERERHDAKELKDLMKQLRPVKDTSLWSLLVGLMQMDTDKHIHILNFVRDAAHRGGK